MIGTAVSHYRIVEQVGGGGMGVVYEAEDTRLGRHVALKFLPDELASDRAMLDRFQQEARAASALSHPNICTVYDIGEHDGRPFIVMELMKGETLQARLRRGPLSVRELAELGSQLADALDAAHAEGIIHRDIKPSNVFVTDRGQGKLLDFGLAKLAPLVQEAETGVLSEQPTTPIAGPVTSPGMTMGTLAYMSPEQVRGDAIDARTDLFSLGVVLYEMATGVQPFRGKTSGVVIDEILNKTPETVRSRVPELPSELERVIDKALSKDRQERYESASSLLASLRALDDEVAPARRPKWIWAAVAAAVVLAGALWSGLGREEVAPPSSPADVAIAESSSSVAVVPFANLSADAENEYFADGLTDELIHALSKVEGLNVPSRTSVFGYKGQQDIDVREVGEELGVANVLEGSVRKSGDRLRITAQLVKVSDGFQLWSETYDREMEDVFAIQEGIARNIVEALEVTLSPRERRAMAVTPTSDVEAYEYYLRGKEFFLSRGEFEDLEFARQMFVSAIEVDPDFAQAHAALADCYSYLFDYHERSPVFLESANRSSSRAVELDPDSAEAHASAGFARSLTGLWQEAEEEFEKAIALNPKLFEAYFYYGRSEFRQGHLEEATRLFERAVELDPWHYQALALLPQVYRSLGREAEMFDANRRLVAVVERHTALNPDDAEPYLFGASSLLELGEPERASEWVRRALEINPDDPSVLYNAACNYALAGRIDDAMDALARSVRSGFSDKEWIEQDSDLNSLRDDARFQSILDGMQSAAPP